MAEASPLSSRVSIASIRVSGDRCFQDIPRFLSVGRETGTFVHSWAGFLMRKLNFMRENYNG